MYATEAYNLSAVFFTATGVVLLWGKLGRDQIRVYEDIHRVGARGV